MQGAFRREHGRGPRALAVEFSTRFQGNPCLGGGSRPRSLAPCNHPKQRQSTRHRSPTGARPQTFLILIATARQGPVLRRRPRAWLALQCKTPAAKPLILPVEQAAGPTPPQRLRAAPGSSLVRAGRERGPQVLPCSSSTTLLTGMPATSLPIALPLQPPTKRHALNNLAVIRKINAWSESRAPRGVKSWEIMMVSL